MGKKRAAKLVRTLCALTEDDVEFLKNYKAETGVPMSELVRKIMEHYRTNVRPDLVKKKAS